MYSRLMAFIEGNGVLRHNMVLGQKKSTQRALQIFIKSAQEAIEKKNEANWNFFRSYKSL
jgi:hypothetical protein